MGRTRLSKDERREIISIAAGSYMRAARDVHKMNDNSNEVSFYYNGNWCRLNVVPGTHMAIHCHFKDEYANSFVNKALVRVIGEKRTDNLSYDNFKSLVKDAKSHLNMYVRWGIITPRGLSHKAAGFETPEELQAAMMQAL